MTAKQAAALAGLAPFDDSGTRRGSRHIRVGRADERSALSTATLSAAKHNPPLKAFRERLRRAEKKARAALVAIARKLLVLANAVLKAGRPWDAQLATIAP